MDEGYVKFHCAWEDGPAPTGIEELVAVRNALHSQGLIGEYLPSKVGYGNVSQRIGDSLTFVVSGTATGGIVKATASHFCTVTHHDLETNSVWCQGPVPASSESLTHAMLYACDPTIQAVVHIHHKGLWEHLLETAISTHPGIAYGTVAMAKEMERLLQTTTVRQDCILAMAGHTEGILIFGHDLQILEKKMGDLEKSGKMK